MAQTGIFELPSLQAIKDGKASPDGYRCRHIHQSLLASLGLKHLKIPIPLGHREYDFVILNLCLSVRIFFQIS
jgi:hypothetical protein